MPDRENLDAIRIAKPDHWHPRQTLDCVNAELHVCCEDPMTMSAEKAVEVMRTWRSILKGNTSWRSIHKPDTLEQSESVAA